MLYGSDDTHNKNRNATPRHVTTCAHDINRKKITPCFFTYFLITKAPKQKLIEKVTLFFGFLWLFQKKQLPLHIINKETFRKDD